MEKQKSHEEDFPSKIQEVEEKLISNQTFLPARETLKFKNLKFENLKMHQNLPRENILHHFITY